MGNRKLVLSFSCTSSFYLHALGALDSPPPSDVSPIPNQSNEPPKHLTNHHKPCGGAAVPRPRPHQPHDVPLQLPRFVKPARRQHRHHRYRYRDGGVARLPPLGVEARQHLLDRLEPPVTALIADTYLVWSVEIGNVRNIPVASLWTMSASVYSVFHFFDLLVQHSHFPVNLEERGEEHVDYIPGLPSTRVADLSTCFYGKGLNVLDRALESVALLSKAQWLLLPSVYKLEAQVIDALRANTSIPVYHIGPTIPHFKLETESRPSEAHYFDWLDKQPSGSVLYVSQGSLHSAPKAQMDEIADGLRESRVRFFWVAREAASELKERCGGMGIVVPWCDQLRVPTSKMIVEDWKIGWRVKKKGVGEEESLVGREEITGIVRRFMDLESEEGNEMRSKARELRDIYRQAIRKGGSTHADLEAFVSDICKQDF
ncbi:PREDICTED: UDP-glycosyltransferase [Prunus dulcis]|uniref:PREDICTED: UDP-glycosyltransferase n=1 Tax=Prunus dulcis TaxID=3755 RepID=A0A5E4EPG0_PRUDU|nr:PREDICTED: UDP-glycosyltransferase [Prunus dulcis]